MDSRRDARLVDEHLGEGVIRREVLMDPLEREEAVKAADPHGSSQVDGGHTAAAELTQDLILPDSFGQVVPAWPTFSFAARQGPPGA